MNEMAAIGDILLLRFPFSDQGSFKKRPALMLLDAGDDDVLVARVTSRRHASTYDIEITDWSRAGLLLPSVVRLHKMATLEKTLIVKRLGRLNDKDLRLIRNKLTEMFAE